MSLCSQLPDGGHYMIIRLHDEIRYTARPKWEIPNLSI